MTRLAPTQNRSDYRNSSEWLHSDEPIIAISRPVTSLPRTAKLLCCYVTYSTHRRNNTSNLSVFCCFAAQEDVAKLSAFQIPPMCRISRNITAETILRPRRGAACIAGAKTVNSSHTAYHLLSSSPFWPMSTSPKRLSLARLLQLRPVGYRMVRHRVGNLNSGGARFGTRLGLGL
jgi:hypothetical protein